MSLAEKFDADEIGDEDVAAIAGKRVVVCEDEGITRMLLGTVLKDAGLDVVASASNGALGVKSVLATKPDIVLMDVKMPVMNGFDAAVEILKQHRPCIVMLTAFNDRESYERARAIGAQGYITKPVDDERVVREIAGAWRGFKASRSET
jgi:two-component system, response regulator PdtaR